MSVHDKPNPNTDDIVIDESLLPRTYEVDKESPLRSVIKAISWRIIASGTTFLIALAFDLKWDKALGIVIIDMLVKLLAYYLHERAWLTVKWGRRWRKNQMVRAIKLWYLRRKRARRIF